MFNFCNKKKTVEGPLLSVVMPVFNHEKFVGEAIESVLNQTYKNLELIIIDDGSSDGSINIIKSYEKDSRIKFIAQENAGAHNAINRGLGISNGEYLAIINSDDVFEINRFEIMINEMNSDSSLGFLCSYITIIDDHGKKLGVKEGWHNMEPWLVPHPELSYKTKDDFALNLLMTNFTSTTSNFLFRRSVYEINGGMRNLRFAHDWDFALRIAQNTKCKIIEKPLMRYRVHGNNTISSNRKWMLFEIVWMWATNLERYFGNVIFSTKEAHNDIFELVESLNLQGNDKVLWMLLIYFQAQRKNGVEKPEEILLENAELRGKFLNYIVE